MNEFDVLLENAGLNPLSAAEVSTIQVNLGLLCNQRCAHCHLDAGGDRTEMMFSSIIDSVLAVLRDERIETLDITGGAPELHPDFRRLVRESRATGVTVIDRCNLTVLMLREQQGTAEFMRNHGVEITASLPCYTAENVDAVRGPGVFDASISALKMLNHLGYGVDPDLVLNLVYNPSGPSLPPDGSELEADYRRELAQRYGISFNRLLALSNCPIGRFGRGLSGLGSRSDYIAILAASFNPDTVPRLMCRQMVSVGWDGRLYDCDFNLALSLGTNHGAPGHISVFDYEALSRRRIVTGQHCLSCTAGRGSSCGGSLVEEER